LKELGLRNPEIKTDIKVKDDTSAKFWAEIFPTILMFILFIIIAMFILGKM
jgi:ATP-dependent Zn protease